MFFNGMKLVLLNLRIGISGLSISLLLTFEVKLGQNYI